MKISPTKISGCYHLQPRVFQDERGRFVKAFHEGLFREHGLETCFVEDYYSVSRRGCLRGLHFQSPPVQHAKLVYCVSGAVLDAVVDIRLDSPTYGQFETFELRAEEGDMIYLTAGLAHGFYTLEENSILIYKVSSVYSPSHDVGILWNSVGIPWPDHAPLLSQRDRTFPPLSHFQSPFSYRGA